MQHLAGFAVFGCGNSVYPEIQFNAVARAVDQQLAALGAARLAPVGLGDEDASASSAGGMLGQFKSWSQTVGVCAVLLLA